MAFQQKQTDLDEIIFLFVCLFVFLKGLFVTWDDMG